MLFYYAMPPRYHGAVATRAMLATATTPARAMPRRRARRRRRVMPFAMHVIDGKYAAQLRQRCARTQRRRC